jgi:hypothetical protein
MRLGDPSVFVDHVCDAFCVFVGRGLCCAVRESDLSFRVAQKRKGKVELAGKGVVVFRRIETDAEDLRVLCLVLVVEVPEPGTFPRSTGCVGFRIEPEHDLFAAQVAETHAIAFVVEDVEVGSDIAGLKHFVILLTTIVSQRVLIFVACR